MANKPESLKTSVLFSTLTPQALTKISSFCISKTFNSGDVVFQEGDEAFGFYIVSSGKVKLYKLSPSGNEHILHLACEGDSIAEAVVFGNMKCYPAYAEALVDSKLLFIPKKEFLSLVKSDFALTLSVFASLSTRLRYFNSLVEELSLKDADARLAKYFLDLSLKKKSDVLILDEKKNELAARLGIAPETLSRLFKKFISNRVIRVSIKKILITNKEALRAISSGQKYFSRS